MVPSTLPDDLLAIDRLLVPKDTLNVLLKLSSKGIYFQNLGAGAIAQQ